MLTDPRPKLTAMSKGFIATHRLVGEVSAGRAVALRDGAALALVAPLDGGPILSETLAIERHRAAYLGLEDQPTLITLPRANPAALWQLATAQVRDLAGEGAAMPLFGGTLRPAGRIETAATELAKLAERLPAMTVRTIEAVPADTLSANAGDVLAFRRTLATTARPIAAAPVPLASGANSVVTAFRDAIGGTVSAVCVGDPEDGSLVRLHSSCITGDVFGSLKCDCGAQLHLSLERISAEGGVLLYVSQEGRGIGLVNKLRAYTLQGQGLDTVDANVALGYHDDERDYALAASVLRQLGLRRVRLLTNNPSKAAGLAIGGLSVDAEPLRGPVTAHNKKYLATKRARSGHTL